MSGVRLISLYSGSSGNAFLIDTPTDAILIDAGRNAKKLCASLAEVGVVPEKIRAIFVTHEHTDHISALPVFLKKHPIPVHLLAGCAFRLEDDPHAGTCLVKHTPIYSEKVANITVTAFPTPHDSHASSGFRIEIPLGDGEILRLGYATDIGYVSNDVRNGLLGCEAVVLESNHDVEMLHTGPYPYVLKQRIASRRGHLSNVDSAAFAAELCENGTRALLLAHLSRENNTPALAFDECLSAVGDGHVRIRVADPEHITEVPL